MTLGPEQLALRVGPRRPMPFPDSGKRVKLLTCPKCQLLGLLWYYAPYERAYPTVCIKCGQRAVIKPKDMTLKGGFTPRAKGIRDSQRWGLDATGFWDERREMVDLGPKRAYQQGFVPAPIDQKLR